jgi:hypothetical protein
MSEQHAYERLVGRAQDDEAFREALLADAPAAIADELGQELPAGVSVRVIEQAADEIVLVLPPQGLTDNVLDAELAGAAGGNYLSGTEMCTFSPALCPPKGI